LEALHDQRMRRRSDVLLERDGLPAIGDPAAHRALPNPSLAKAIALPAVAAKQGPCDLMWRIWRSRADNAIPSPALAAQTGPKSSNRFSVIKQIHFQCMSHLTVSDRKYLPSIPLPGGY